MTDVADLFRRYLQTRISLGEPEVVLPELDRTRARRLARRAAVSGLSGMAGPPGGTGEQAVAADSASDDDGAGPTGTVTAAEPADRDEGPGTTAAAGSGDGSAGTPSGAGDGTRSRGGDSSLPDAPGPAADGEPGLPAEELERLGREATAEEIGELADMATLRAVAERCTRCPLHEERQRVVFGEGSADADLVCVGEAPGAREDETGRPFVGPAGQLLDRLLLSVGFPREEVYICNVLKSRPPGNRDPRDEEIEACSPFLLRQLDLLDPKVIVAFGAFAARTLTGRSDSLGGLRDQVHAFQGYPLVATYHPAALLRNRSWTRPTWDDLQRARRIVDGEAVTDAAEQLGLV